MRLPKNPWRLGPLVALTIAMSGDAQSNDKAISYEAGIQQHLPKRIGGRKVESGFTALTRPRQ